MCIQCKRAGLKHHWRGRQPTQEGSHLAAKRAVAHSEASATVVKFGRKSPGKRNKVHVRGAEAVFTGPHGMGHSVSQGIKAAALAASLAGSALLVTLALRVPECQWLAWFSFGPLFVAVRSLRPASAALSGVLWGACLYLCFTAGPLPAGDVTAMAMGPSLRLLLLLTLIPAVYAGLAALPARAIGFKLLTLALGWTLLEIVLQLHSPVRPHDGLLAGSQGEGPYLPWLVRLLAYVLTAFVIACANASLIGILSGVRLILPTRCPWAGSLDAIGWLPSPRVRAIPSWNLRRAYPRAPPIPVATLS